VYDTRSFYDIQLANEVRNPILATILMFDNVLLRNWLVETMDLLHGYILPAVNGVH